MEVAAMLLCSAAAVWVAFTKCPCAAQPDEAAKEVR